MSHISRDVFMPEISRDRVVDSTWARIVELADRHTVPGEFSAFVAYEYTSMPDGQNLHRNVIFKGSEVPARPFSTFDSQNPEDLWRWMDEARVPDEPNLHVMDVKAAEDFLERDPALDQDFFDYPVDVRETIAELVAYKARHNRRQFSNRNAPSAEQTKEAAV